MQGCDPEKEKYWRSILAKFEATELSGAKFCQKEGLRYCIFSDWRQKIRRLDGGSLVVRQEQPDSEWLQIIEDARKHPGGVAAFCDERGLDKKLYYRRFKKFRRSHPEWQSLTRAGRKPGSKNKPKSKTSEVQTVTKTSPAVREFAEVHILDSPRNKTIPSTFDVVLPSSVIVRVGTDCSMDFLSTLISALENR